MSHRTDELTGLRGAAITWVIVSHAEHKTASGYRGWFAALRRFATAASACSLFFVLSGFPITGLSRREWQRADESIDRSFF
ncbi:hypothetical protein WS67_12600 [Burkholderia singularis]|uniref:Acyltransferase 3 domain-containing protein n=1 Tax=Burkholderia singularis TaxID=1503053 RepID=A0A124P941_9BURK|nr:hypothetical protein [Burkholderia singularis]KVE27322.1 hypothetical protein WS67_12600 [Burkholderia singularis]